jgi:hypothetical protein
VSIASTTIAAICLKIIVHISIADVLPLAPPFLFVMLTAFHAPGSPVDGAYRLVFTVIAHG